MMPHSGPKQFTVLIIMTTALAVHAFPASADLPQTINYQGYLADSGGEPVNGSVNMTFGLYTAATGTAAPLWTETQGTVSVVNGVYSVILGSETPIGLPFDAQYYLGVKVGADQEMTPRQALTGTPYAFRSSIADSMDDLAISGTMIATGAISPDKLALVCNEGETLIQTMTGWQCSPLCISSTEVCDGRDNDCNGLADDGLQGSLCPLQQGVCSGSRQKCGGAEGWLPCDYGTYAAYHPLYETTEESCDGKDNDCDGQADNGLTAPACPLQWGVCIGSTKTCGGASGWLNCTASNYGPYYGSDGPGSCDGFDNDCDGIADDSFVYGGSVYYTDWNFSHRYKGDGCGTGWCSGGRAVCATTSSLTCDSLVALTEEKGFSLCDGEDNDCDGMTDDLCGGSGGINCQRSSTEAVNICRGCTADDQCGAGWKCAGFGTKTCAKSCTVNADCQGAPLNSGWGCYSAGGQNVCAKTCTADSDCNWPSVSRTFLCVGTAPKHCEAP
jgi:hypothetical protein